MSSLTDLLAGLVAIDSVNPAYGGPGEAAIAAAIHSRLRAAGVATFIQPVTADRANVVGVLTGRDRTRRIVLEAHMDTVSVAGMTVPPFDPVVRDGRLFGRGACDVKGGLAAMLQAVLDVAEAGVQPPCDVWLAAVVDEEHAYTGVLALIDGLAAAGSAEAAVVAEPTRLRIVTATKGVLRFRIRLQGKAAHSSQPWLGTSAVSAAARVVLALDTAHEALAAARAHPLLGQATGCVGLIAGGVQVNIVPETCEIAVDRRLLPGEDAAAVLDGYRRLVSDLLGDGPVRTACEPLLTDPPLETPSTTAVVRTAATAAAALGLDASPIGVPYGSDASKLSRDGIPAIVFGPGSIDDAHAADESVSLDAVATAAAFYREFLLRFA